MKGINLIPGFFPIAANFFIGVCRSQRNIIEKNKEMFLQRNAGGAGNVSP